METYTLKDTQGSGTFTREIKETLNPAQQEAALFNDGPILVIAGAGSGKTKTLVYRVARLVDEGVSPESILLLTFTRKASQEMLERATTVLDERCHRVSGGTFHSFANSMLRRYAPAIGYDANFTILDRGDSEDLIQQIRKEKEMGAGDKRFPKKATIASVIGKAVNTGKSIETLLGIDFPQFLPFARDIEAIARDYQQQKHHMRVMDYDDLLTKFYSLLSTCPDIREKLQHQFQYIMVDEFQDTNAIQSNIIRHLVNDKQNVMAVGDDSQSIYSFRGADFKNIMSFPDTYPDATVIKLEENYRSDRPILDLTNAIISGATEKYAKNLFTSKEGGQKPTFIDCKSDNEQSKFICQKILELREQGINLKDIAVLMRSGWHSNDLEVELQSANLPFVKQGGFKFIEAAHIKDIIAYMRVIFNPLDSLSWNRILTQFEGLGPKSANKIINDIQEGMLSPVAAISGHQKKAYYQELVGLVNLVLNPMNKEVKPSQIVQAVLDYYIPIFKMTYDNFTKRESDLDSFLAISERYPTLESFINEMSLDPPTSTDAEADSDDKEKLTLSTIHSAKGLEWNTVFMLSAVDGYLPSFQSLNDPKQLEEERRLMYVALTRAEKNLFILKPNLTYAATNYYRHTGMSFAKPSRFLEESNILKSYTDELALVPEEKQKRFSNTKEVPFFFQDAKKEDNGRKYYF